MPFLRQWRCIRFFMILSFILLLCLYVAQHQFKVNRSGFKIVISYLNFLQLGESISNESKIRALKLARLIPHTFNSSSTSYIWYNRVPKCGSSTVFRFMKYLREPNDFRTTYGVFYNSPQVSQTKAVQLYKDQILAKKPPILTERHMHFIDFSSYNLTQPIYINVIRDPFDRMISWYYYRRSPTKKLRISGLGNDSRTMSFDECVLTNNDECMQPEGDSFERGYFKIIPYFCGQQDYCREKSTIQNEQQNTSVRCSTDYHAQQTSL